MTLSILIHRQTAGHAFGRSQLERRGVAEGVQKGQQLLDLVAAKLWPLFNERVERDEGGKKREGVVLKARLQLGVAEVRIGVVGEQGARGL